MGGSDIQASLEQPEHGHVRIPTLEQLSCHPYFYKSRMDDEEDRVMAEFERIECQIFNTNL